MRDDAQAAAVKRLLAVIWTPVVIAPPVMPAETSRLKICARTTEGSRFGLENRAGEVERNDALPSTDNPASAARRRCTEKARRDTSVLVLDLVAAQHGARREHEVGI